MTCRHCGTDDPALLERTDHGAIYCNVCSQISAVPTCDGRMPLRPDPPGPEAWAPVPARTVGQQENIPMRRCCGVLSVLALIGGVLAAPAAAQTVINPRFMEFLASPDHTVTLPDGSPLVASYEARWYIQGATTPVAKISLAKPTPDATGVIRLSLLDPKDLLVGVPIDPKVTYVARVAAIAPDGTEGVSTDSNPFVRTTSPKAPGPPKLSK